VSTWLPALARILNAKRPFRAPVWLARLIAGDHVVTLMTQARAGSNAKAKKELGWRPSYCSWREGFTEVAARLPS
jgi:nucleoside-diphosphate-sugar epimerase